MTKYRRVAIGWTGHPWHSLPINLENLHGEMPLESGGEIQNLSFWWQTFNMLSINDNNESILLQLMSTVFDMDASAGSATCAISFSSYYTMFYWECSVHSFITFCALWLLIGYLLARIGGSRAI